MLAKEALKLAKGTKLRYKLNGQEVTVKEVLTGPTAEEPKGNFPLIVTEEMGAVSYLGLRFPVKKE
jgi:hypothetical protein